MLSAMNNLGTTAELLKQLDQQVKANEQTHTKAL